MSTLGERIKESRERKDLYQAQLAELIGVKSAGVISNWEKDINKPNADKLVEICQVLDISLSYLLDYYGNENTSPYSGEAMKLADDYDKRLDHYGRKQVRSVADNEIARVEAANTKMEAGEIEVDAELAEYSRQLNLQKKAETGSSASSGSEGKGA